MVLEITVSRKQRAEDLRQQAREGSIDYHSREPKDRDWSAINKAGNNEASTFKHLLATLVNQLENGTNQGRGRNGIDTRDMIFNICLTEYLNTSNRRVPSQLKEAEEQGYTTGCAYNTLTKYMKKEEIRNKIQKLIMKSAAPLKGHEETFAIDATGFSDSRFGNWQNHKYRKQEEHRLWKKLHAACGVKSNIITAATVTKGTTHDQTQFEPLVEMTNQYFNRLNSTRNRSTSQSPMLQHLHNNQNDIRIRTRFRRF